MRSRAVPLQCGLCLCASLESPLPRDYEERICFGGCCGRFTQTGIFSTFGESISWNCAARSVRCRHRVSWLQDTFMLPNLQTKGNDRMLVTRLQPGPFSGCFPSSSLYGSVRVRCYRGQTETLVLKAHPIFTGIALPYIKAKSVNILDYASSKLFPPWYASRRTVGCPLQHLLAVLG